MIDWMPMANRVNWEGKVFDHCENFTRLKRGERNLVLPRSFKMKLINF